MDGYIERERERKKNKKRKKNKSFSRGKKERCNGTTKIESFIEQEGVSKIDINAEHGRTYGSDLFQ